MNRFGDIVQKAMYLGIGLASYAGENLQELREQAQKLADEMVVRGKMNTEEARRYVDELVQQAQQDMQQQPDSTSEIKEPRPIEIVEEEENPEQEIDHLRQQVQALQDQLRNLKQN